MRFPCLLACLVFWPLFDIGNHEVMFDFVCGNHNLSVAWLGHFETFNSSVL